MINPEAGLRIILDFRPLEFKPSLPEILPETLEF